MNSDFGFDGGGSGGGVALATAAGTKVCFLCLYLCKCWLCIITCVRRTVRVYAIHISKFITRRMSVSRTVPYIRFSLLFIEGILERNAEMTMELKKKCADDASKRQKRHTHEHTPHTHTHTDIRQRKAQQVFASRCVFLRFSLFSASTCSFVSARVCVCTLPLGVNCFCHIYNHLLF